MKDSPSDLLRKSLPKGDANWTGFPAVWSNLQKAAIAMGLSNTSRLSDFHIRTMAVMGTGHEETMKAHLHLIRQYGWL